MEKKGYLTIKDIRLQMQKYNENIKGEDLHAILDEIDTNQNGQVELDEYLQVNWLLRIYYIPIQGV